MECERNNQKLSELLDGQLSNHEKDRVLDHIKCCRRCAEDYQELKSVRLILRNLPADQANPVFWGGVYSRIHEISRQRQRKSIFPWAAPHLAWGTACAVLFIMLMSLAPSTLNQAFMPTPTINPDALISLHASTRITQPLADPGTLRSIYTQANANEWTDDQNPNGY